jgi:hypothetical protein
MDRCNSGGESSQKKQRIGRERVTRKKVKVREEVEKSRKHGVFPMSCGLRRVEK